MKLTKSTDFAIRLVIELASREDFATMPDLSRVLFIPYDNLSKLVQTLSRASIIQTKQGKNGGIRMVRDPQDVSIKEIIEIVEGPVRLSDCTTQQKACQLECNCKLRNAFSALEEKFNVLLEDVTIKSLI